MTTNTYTAADRARLMRALYFIDPASLSYEEWLEIGMILKGCGIVMSVWDTWSQRDPDRYDATVIREKWEGFSDTCKDKVGPGTLIMLAKVRGWTDDSDIALMVPAAKESQAPSAQPSLLLNLPHRDVPVPPHLSPADQSRAFLRAVRKPGEYITVVTEAKYDEKSGKWKPCGKGTYYTFDEAMDHAEDILASGNPDAGIWVRVNPMTLGGASNEDVTDYRYVLVECDDLPIDEQLRLIADLNLPCPAIIFSGGKSVHAIVRIDAKDAEEYKERVRRLYDVCKANGLSVDESCKNAGRLTRLPGATRADEVQTLIATDFGLPTWSAWTAFVERHKRGLYIHDMADYTGAHTPEKRPALIDGLLREGGKMIITGPPKSHKSMEAIHLALALATGDSWYGHRCKRTRVLYVNTELDECEFTNRVEEVRRAMHLDLSQYRGRAKFISTAGATLGKGLITISSLCEWMMDTVARGEYGVIIIDPIYKLEEGDEDTATVNAFLLELDRLRAQLGCSIIYTHHTAKGGDAYKTVYEEGRGSGNWGGDADAVISISELTVNEQKNADAWDAMRELGIANPATAAYRIRFGARSFAEPPDINVFKTYPLFTVDARGLLLPLGMRGSAQARGGTTTANHYAEVRALKNEATTRAIEACKAAGKPTTRSNVYEFLPAACAQFGIETPQEGTFKDWTSRTTGCCLYRTDPTQDNVLRLCETDTHGRVVYENDSPKFLSAPGEAA
ncbi:MAG: AAA family ATPase [Atopobium sp.]|mgnify:CR=1 FL=1|nr:AAA family ATPase [Atopobium sp.]